MKCCSKEQISDKLKIENTNIRIGKFAEKNSMSVDTIRYYVHLNLIHPLRKGRYFYFGTEQQEQLDFIKHYKDMRFSLDDIKILMYTVQLRILETPVKSDYIENMFHDKRVQLLQERKRLDAIIDKLDAEIEAVKQQPMKHIDGKGIAFQQLELLCCPTCQKRLSIEEGILKNHSVSFGKIKCHCGVTMVIEEGILLTSEIGNKDINPEKGKDSIRNLFKNTSHTFIEQMLYYVEEMTRCIMQQDIASKTVLFMKTGAGTLALNLLRKFPKVGMLILLDEDLSQLKVTKKTIDIHYPDYNILYVSGSLDMLPIKKESVDLAIDFTASFDAAFEKSYNLYQDLIPHMNTHSMIIGLYLYFKKSTILTRFDLNQRKLLDGIFIRKYLEQNGYQLIENGEEYTLKMGKNVDEFYHDGDRIITHLDIYNR